MSLCHISTMYNDYSQFEWQPVFCDRFLHVWCIYHSTSIRGGLAATHGPLLCMLANNAKGSWNGGNKVWVASCLAAQKTSTQNSEGRCTPTNSARSTAEIIYLNSVWIRTIVWLWRRFRLHPNLVGESVWSQKSIRNQSVIFNDIDSYAKSQGCKVACKLLVVRAVLRHAALRHNKQSTQKRTEGRLCRNRQTKAFACVTKDHALLLNILY